MNWDSIVQKISPHVVKIETPDGSGTGFLFAYNADRRRCGIATALHVVSEANDWQKPIKIHRHDFGTPPVFLPEASRIIFTDYPSDSAVILFLQAEDLKLPSDLIQLRPVDSHLAIGVELGWMGFPSLEPYTLCFFSGNISARQAERRAYLIDGVAIHGVSGGPVIFSSAADGCQFVGIVSAYRSGSNLPGLLVAQDVSHFHNVISTLKTWDEAKQKKAEEEARKKEAESAPKSPQAKPEPSEPVS
ncbi:MAG TPA: hypothetical protein VGI60_02740 [Chthoniobacterales bacterium]|jgi:hypothetical protein